MEKAVIIGAGPAGLTAAYELLKGSKDIEVVVIEETDSLGGISKTVHYKGNRMDMGGHRFFSKDPRVNSWWCSMMPKQGQPSMDDKLLNRKTALESGGPDPESTDRVMLFRHRISRILFDSKFYDYPISLKWDTFKNLGLTDTILIGFSYFRSVINKLPETNLENFYINRFGKKLYSMFFEYYTENLWGRHPRDIDASWGYQRVKGVSVTEVIRNYMSEVLRKKNRRVETSLIEEFLYPKLGPGQLWEITAEKIRQMGGTILTETAACSLSVSEGRIRSVHCKDPQHDFDINADYVISSMPVKDLVLGINDVPQNIRDIAVGLKYRDYITLGVLVSSLKLKNLTDIPTLGNIIPDCWIYVQDRHVKMGRIQIYNNWSPYLVKDPLHTVWIGLEYFVNEGDDMWNMSESSFSEYAVDEMLKLGLIDSKEEIIDTHMERVKKAYPAYFDTYADFDLVKDYLLGIENLFCVGRNGQHRYNNMDHSMITSFEAVSCILSGAPSKESIWNVNTEREYHEER